MTGGEGGGEGEGGEGEENCHMLIMSLLNEGAVIRQKIAILIKLNLSTIRNLISQLGSARIEYTYHQN